MAPRKEQGQQQQGWYPRPFFSYLSKAEALEDIAAIQSSTRRESRMPARYGGSHAAPSNAPRKTDLESFTAAGQPSHPPSQQWQPHTVGHAAQAPPALPFAQQSAHTTQLQHMQMQLQQVAHQHHQDMPFKASLPGAPFPHFQQTYAAQPSAGVLH